MTPFPIDGGSKGPLVFHIQRFSLHDGPGIRTVVFLKGCPLRCRWCCNPESLLSVPELAYRKSLCIGVELCGRCVESCPNGAIHTPGAGKGAIGINRERCTACGACVSSCPARALTIMGQTCSSAELLAQVEQDDAYYRHSGGGVTLSGGEPLAWPALAAEFLLEARARGLHTALETCGWCDLDDPDTRTALENLDLLFFDLKHMDSALHKQFTAVDNIRILDNLRRVGREFNELPIIVRTPVVPGFNDTEAAIRDIARHAARIPTVQGHELLPYHSFGEPKYAQLGLPYHMAGMRNLPAVQLEALCRESDCCMAQAGRHTQSCGNKTQRKTSQ